MLDHHDAQAVGAIFASIGSWHALQEFAPNLTVSFAVLVSIGVGGVLGWHAGATVKRAWKARRSRVRTWRSVRPRFSRLRVLTFVVILGLSVFAVGAVYGTGVGPVDRVIQQNVDVSTPSDVETLGDVSDEFNETRVEDLVLDEVNTIRANHGMVELRYNPRAASKAKIHAKDMARNHYFNHTSLSGQTQIERYSFCGGGENAAKVPYRKSTINSDGNVVTYTSEEELAGAIVDGWMNSRPHRVRGIYGDRWRSAGVGVALSENNIAYAVLGFCSR